MSNIIKLRTISSVDDKRARLANSNFARLWSSDLGTTWTKIRIGCRLSIEDSGAAISGAKFAFGICSGTSNIFMDATTTHWLGVIHGNYGATLNRGAGPPVQYNNYIELYKKVATTLTLIDFGNSNTVYMRDCTTANRAVMFLDITKGSPFTLRLFCCTSASGDVSVTTYLDQLPVASPTITGHAFGNAVTTTIDEATNGYFNAVNVAWDKSSPAIEISDLAVVRLS